MKDRKSVTCNGRAAFYAAIWNDLRQAAMDCGWALGLHGSLASDMDIMAMPWVENATSAEVMVESLIKCFGFSDYWVKYQMQVDRTSKPNGRVVYTVPIHGDFYLDINVIEREKTEKEKYLDLPITELDLNTRAFRIFADAKIRTLRDLVTTPRQTLLRYRNCGNKTVAEISKVLHRDWGINW